MIRTVDEAHLGAMLQALADDGWQPVLYCEGGATGRWVCHPEAHVRTYYAGRGVTAWAAVYALYAFARVNPNDPGPRFTPSLEAALRWAGGVMGRDPSPTPVTPIDRGVAP